MEGNPWDQQNTLSGDVHQPVVVGAFDAGNTIMIQQVSKAAKIIGIICMILGLFSFLGLATPFTDAYDLEGNLIVYSTTLQILMVLSALVSALTFTIGGYWMMNYEKRGVQLILIGIAVGFFLSVAQYMNGGDGGLVDFLGDGLGYGILIGTSAICNGICGLIVAIPLLQANGGLEEPSLF